MRELVCDAPAMTADCRDGSLAPASSIESPGRMVPASMTRFRSVRSALASAIAPCTLSSPVPCCSRLLPGIGVAVYWRIALTSGGVRPGLASSIRATAPATTGAATEVPLRDISSRVLACVAPCAWASTGRPGLSSASRFQPAAASVMSEPSAATTRLPGATMSGLSRLSTQPL